MELGSVNVCCLNFEPPQVIVLLGSTVHGNAHAVSTCVGGVLYFHPFSACLLKEIVCRSNLIIAVLRTAQFRLKARTVIHLTACHLIGDSKIFLSGSNNKVPSSKLFP